MFDSPGSNGMPGNAFGPLVSGMAGWENESNYAQGSMQLVAGPVLASLPSGGSTAAGGGEAGGEVGGEPCGLSCAPPPPPPPQDCYAGPQATCVPPPPPVSLTDQDWITATVRDTTSLKKLFDEGLGIDETIRLRQGKITGTSPEPGTSDTGPQSTSNDSPELASTPISGIQPQPPTPDLPAGNGTPPRWLQPAFDDLDSAPVNGGTITEDTTPSTQTGNSGNNIGNGGNGGSGTPPAGNAADCDAEGGGLGEPVSGRIPYGSSAFTRLIQDQRVLTNDTKGNYAVGCLKDGTIVMGRSSSSALHAELDVIRQAGLRWIVDLYSEREPCQERCATLTQG